MHWNRFDRNVDNDKMYRHIHQGISVAYRIRWMSNKQHTVRNGDTDRYPCCFMIGCWAEKPKHQHKSWIAYSLSHGSEPRTQNSESYSSSTQYARNIDIIVYTAFYTWNVRILCVASGGIYSAPNGSNNTRRSQILFVVCATFVWCFFYTCSLSLSVYSFRCVPVHWTDHHSMSSSSPTLCIPLLVCLFILRAFVRPHLMSIVSILNFIDLMLLHIEWALFYCAAQCSAPYNA